MDRFHVDRLPRDHFIRDARQSRDIDWDRQTRLTKAAIGACDIADPPCGIKGKCNQSDLDDLVLAVIEPGRLGIEDDPDQREFGSQCLCDRPHFEPLQDTIASSRHQMGNHRLLIYRRRPRPGC